MAVLGPTSGKARVPLLYIISKKLISPFGSPFLVSGTYLENLSN